MMTTHTFFGGAKELGIVYINRIRGAKEPRNPKTIREMRHDVFECVREV